jgi:hypothetical protein
MKPLLFRLESPDGTNLILQQLSRSGEKVSLKTLRSNNLMFRVGSEGYVIGDGDEYLCDSCGESIKMWDKCSEAGYATPDDAYEDGFYYHTAWEDEDEFEAVCDPDTLECLTTFDAF